MPTVDIALLFPPLDHWEGVPEVSAHQALLHEVMWRRKRGDCPIPSLFMDERCNVVQSSIPWLSWQHTLQRNRLSGSLEAWTSNERSTGPILDMLP